MRHHQSCKTHVLAQNKRFQITACHKCEHISLHMGGLSLRFSLETTEQLWMTLGKALSQFAHHTKETPAPQPNLFGDNTCRHDIH